MNKILIFEELEAYVYNKCFILYSILYDDLRKIIKLLEGAYFEKYFKKSFGDRPHPPREKSERIFLNK